MYTFYIALKKNNFGNNPLFLLLVNKTLLNYMAYIKIEVNKISDVQQQILQQISVLNEGCNYCNSNKTPAALVEEIDYFVSTWPLSSHDELNDMEQKIQFEQDFKNKVVINALNILC